MSDDVAQYNSEYLIGGTSTGTSQSNQAPPKKEFEISETVARPPLFTVEEKKYGINKPIRKVIRAKIIND